MTDLGLIEDSCLFFASNMTADGKRFPCCVMLQKCSCKMLCVVKKSLWKLDIFISMHIGLMMLAKVFFFTTKIRFFFKYTMMEWV